jgi:hypothetical protein
VHPVTVRNLFALRTIAAAAKNNANGSRPETTNAAGDVAITGRTSSQVR